MDQSVNAAVLFADISGSTKLYESAGDAAAAAAIEQCIALFRNRTGAMGGRVVKTIGDEVMAKFPTADACLNSAVAMQMGIAALRPVGGVALGVRIGFQAGAVVEREGDVFGDTVNLAARLTELAQRDQIITSRETMEALSPALRSVCRQLYSVQIKGKEHEVALCEVVWRESDEKTALVGPWSGASQATEARGALRLRHGATEIMLDDNRKSLLLGRDKSSELVIADTMASRSHCKIEQRRDKFILADYSANGTYVTVEGDREIMLRREEFTLRGHGRIAFGQPLARTDEMVEFYCEERYAHAEFAVGPGENSARIYDAVTQVPQTTNAPAPYSGMMSSGNSVPTGTPTGFPNSNFQTRAPVAAARFDPQTLATAEKALAKYIGVVARVVVKRAAARASDARELYQMLADEIEDPGEKKAFIRNTL